LFLQLMVTYEGRHNHPAPSNICITQPCPLLLLLLLLSTTNLSSV
jgi:hypothetical protein